MIYDGGSKSRRTGLVSSQGMLCMPIRSTSLTPFHFAAFENESHKLGALGQRDWASEFAGLAGLVDEIAVDVEGRQKHAAVRAGVEADPAVAQPGATSRPTNSISGD